MEGTNNGRIAHRGVAQEYGDRVLIIPPLPLGIVRQRSDEREQLTENGAIFDHMIGTITLALRRNYTAEELSDEDIKDFVTMRNVSLLNAAAIGADNDKDGKPLPFGHLARSEDEVIFQAGVPVFNPAYQPRLTGTTSTGG